MNLLEWDGICGQQAQFRPISSDSEVAISSATSKVLLYPNPSTGQFTVLAEDDLSGLVLTDIHGKIVLEKKNLNLKTLTFKEQFQPGIYLLRLSYINGSTETHKLIIE